MKKYVSLDKRSKKAQKEYYTMQRRTWGELNPVTRSVPMLMYGKEASNRKQEIDRQHYTIPNQRPKDKHCGKI